MRCPICKRNLPDHARKCNYCGTIIRGNPDSDATEIVDGPGSWADDYEPERKKGIDRLTIYILLVSLLLIAAISGLVIMIIQKRAQRPGEPGESPVAAATEKEKEDEEEMETEAAEEYEPATSQPAESTTSQPAGPSATQAAGPSEPVIPYTDNASCDVGRNLEKDAFEYMHCDEGGYSFIYPKYIFNHVKYNPDTCGYYFSYIDGNGTTLCAMNVYREEDSADDAVSKAKSFRKRFDPRFSAVNYWWPSKNLSDLTHDQNSQYKEPRGDGYARYIMGGWTDSSKDEHLYMLGANKDSYSYYLEFYFPDYDSKNDMEDWDYILECVYRGLEFGGASYSPRSWEAFKSEGYGEGHH